MGLNRSPIGSIQTPAYAGALAALEEYDRPNINSYKTLITRELDLSVGFNSNVVGSYDLFDVSGTVVIALGAQCTAPITSAGNATLSAGVTSANNVLLGKTNRILSNHANVAAGAWLAATNLGPFHARKYGTTAVDLMTLAYLVQEDEAIVWNVAVAAMTVGTIVVYCWYLPLDAAGISNVTEA